MSSAFREPATARFFPSAHAHSAELKLAYALDNGIESAAVIGAPGLGKTTLLRRAAAKAEAAGHAVVDVFFPSLGPDDLLAFIGDELGAETGAALAGESRLRNVAASVRKLGEAGRGLVVLIDDAHLIRATASLETLHLLLNLRERESVPITLLLAGQPSLIADLRRAPALAQRVGVTAVLHPLRRDETEGYVRHRLAASGDERSFEPTAIDLLHDRSGGVPRAIDRLAEIALLIAESDDRAVATRNDVEAAACETGAADLEAA